MFCADNLQLIPSTARTRRLGHIDAKLQSPWSVVSRSLQLKRRSSCKVSVCTSVRVQSSRVLTPNV